MAVARKRKSKQRSVAIRGERHLATLLAGSDVTIQVGNDSDKTLPDCDGGADDPTDAQQQIRDLEKSKLARQFYDLWQQLNDPDLKTEHRFHPIRRYRFDFAHPATKVSIEIDGGTYSRKRTAHNWGPGITRDATKQNLAITLGWRTFRLTSDMLAKKEIAHNLLPIIEYIRKREAALQNRRSGFAG